MIKRYKIVFVNKSEKMLKGIDRIDKSKILAKISKLRSNPHLGKKLKGNYKDCYSLRAWPYRIIYKINDSNNLILIIRIGHRQGVYV